MTRLQNAVNPTLDKGGLDAETIDRHALLVPVTSRDSAAAVHRRAQIVDATIDTIAARIREIEPVIARDVAEAHRREAPPERARRR